MSARGPRCEKRTGGQSTSRWRGEVEVNVTVDELVAAAINAALPDRLYLIDTQGGIAYKSGRGPMGFKPQELEAAIREVVGEAKVS
jgi:hypothetical protein